LILPWANCEFRLSGLPLIPNSDLATPPDDVDLAMSSPGDLDPDAPDLLMPPMTPDLAVPPDLAMPRDLAIPRDLSMCNPPPIGDTVGPGPNLAITLSNVKVAGGGKLAHVAAGATFTVSVDYSISDSGGNNIDQIIVGIAPSSPQDCLFNNRVHNQTITGNGTATLTAPTTPGTYTLRFHYGQARSCDPTNWWPINGAPTSAQDFAAICVP
jgi:hypothetical protein